MYSYIVSHLQRMIMLPVLLAASHVLFTPVSTDRIYVAGVTHGSTICSSHCHSAVSIRTQVGCSVLVSAFARLSDILYQPVVYVYMRFGYHFGVSCRRPLGCSSALLLGIGCFLTLSILSHVHGFVLLVSLHVV